MSDERLVMALLAEGNPATEVAEEASTGVPAATYLATLEQRSSDMTQLETQKSEEESKRLWTTPWLVAAIAVIVLGVAAIVLNQAGVPAIPLEVADGDPQAAEEFHAVEAAFHAFNTGDPVWVDVRAMGNAEAPSDEERAQDVLGLQADHDLNGRLDVTGCESRGYGDWSEVTDPGVPTPTGYYFICQAFETNSLWDMAGIQMATTYHWVVDNGAVVAVMNREVDAEVVAFREAFDVWLEEAHPEVEVDTLMSNPETVPTVLEYAEEFVAQSEDYPIETGAP